MKGWKHFQPSAAAQFDKRGRRKRPKKRKCVPLVLYGRPTEKFLARARALRMRIILRGIDELPEPRR